MQPLEAGDPQRIGAYDLMGRLGSGGMGEVFLGRADTGRLAAVKAARTEYANDTEFRRRFAREVEAARRVDGRFTAAVLDADPQARRPWLATEYIPGVSVTEAVAVAGPLPESAQRALLAGIAAALEAIHRTGITHRDLKPSNVLLADDGPRVIDFGIARAGDHTQITATGMAPGTPGYMAPEQLRSGAVGPAADVYALGATLVFAATGRGPFGQGDPLAMVYRTMEEEPQLDGVPGELRPVLARCLAKDPDRRPTVAELRAAFAVGSTLPHGRWLPREHGTLVLGRQQEAQAAATMLRPGGSTPAVPDVPTADVPTPVPAAVPTPTPTPTPVPVPAAETGRGLSRRSLLLTGAGGVLAAAGGTFAVLRLRGDDGAGGSTAAPPPSDGTPEPSDSASTSASAEESPAAAGEDGGLPAITSGRAFGEKPTLAVGHGEPPSELVVHTLVQGGGAKVAAGDHVTCHYVLQPWDRAEVIDSSFERGEPFVARLGAGEVIDGWEKALVGREAGSRVEFAVPPALAYGTQGQGPIKGTDTLVFVVDILKTGKARG